MKRFVSKTSSGKTLPIEGNEENRLDDLVIVHVRQQVLKFSKLSGIFDSGIPVNSVDPSEIYTAVILQNSNEHAHQKRRVRRDDRRIPELRSFLLRQQT